ncbi:MAG: dienelactone hydrolase family protein [Alphaproteobacteria bacterium]|nr:dienelactone hydrolase family protein [Alphaproteobacteria bacterium]
MDDIISRRSVVKGIAAGVPLAAVLADPNLAHAVAQTLAPVSITAEGGRKVIGALAVPAETQALAVLVIHEWWGLNDQIKSVAAELATNGFLALAVDLFGGKVTTNADEAARLSRMVAANQPPAIDTLKSWIAWLKKNPRCDGHVATLGYCFGGGWSLNASLATPVDATVVYYGDVRKTAAALGALKGPVLMHYGLKDRYITTAMVEGFEAEARKAGKRVTIYAYDANHAFANPTGAAFPYVKDAADLAWKRTIAFLKANDT